MACLSGGGAASAGADSSSSTEIPCRGDIDFVEVFAGDAATSKAMRALGYSGLSLCVLLRPEHDVLTPCGFLVLLAAVLRLRKGTILWAAPPCSTWAFYPEVPRVVT